MILRTLGHILLTESLLLVLPVLVSILYGEHDALMFLISAALCGAVGAFLSWVPGRHADSSIHAREGFVIVALAWICVSLFGAVPFILTGSIPGFFDAFFETVSGFTTTGATILTDVEVLSHGVMFWRSFTHWVGGMGVLVFMLTVVPMTGGGAVYIIRAEMPGPAPGKLVPRLKDTAKILYFLYLILTLLEVVLLCAGGMPVFDSLVHSFGTAGTGGFGIWNNSIAHYESSYIHWVICIFMLLFGVNFNLYYFLMLRHFRDVWKNDELRVYVLIVVAAVALITMNILDQYDAFSTALRDASFQVASIITTTGYVTANYDLWPEFSKTILVTLMFIGGCAGSTGGGIKVSRFILMKRVVCRGIKRMIHPRSVGVVKMDGKTAGDGVVEGAGVYLMVYCAIATGTVLLLSLDGFSFTVNFSAMASCFNNVGPGLDMVGAVGNYSAYSAFSKFVLSIVMLAGRLEIFPMLILLTTLIPRFNGGKRYGKNRSNRSSEEI